MNLSLEHDRFNDRKLTVQGYVLSTDCRTPLANAKIEIWQVIIFRNKHLTDQIKYNKLVCDTVV